MINKYPYGWLPCETWKKNIEPEKMYGIEWKKIYAWLRTSNLYFTDLIHTILHSIDFVGMIFFIAMGENSISVFSTPKTRHE